MLQTTLALVSLIHSLWNAQEHVRKSGPVIVPGRAALIWPGLSPAHFMQDSIPAWNMHGRNQSQVFSRWLFDEGVQCKAATLDTTVCADTGPTATSSGIQAIVPWLGGDYNPWEGCDTEQTGDLPDGEYANEAVSTSCHPLICPIDKDSSGFLRNHPTNSRYRCSLKNGEVVSRMRNVPSKYRTNLCRRKPAVPDACTNPHGMLMGLQGRPVNTLYGETVVRHRDEVVARTGAGLFWHGGNPIYYTAKGMAEDVARDVQVRGVNSGQCTCFYYLNTFVLRAVRTSEPHERPCRPPHHPEGRQRHRLLVDWVQQVHAR